MDRTNVISKQGYFNKIFLLADSVHTGHFKVWNPKMGLVCAHLTACGFCSLLEEKQIWVTDTEIYFCEDFVL